MKTRILVEVEVPEGTFTYRTGKAQPVTAAEVFEEVRGGVHFRLSGCGNDWTRTAIVKMEVLNDDENPC